MVLPQVDGRTRVVGAKTIVVLPPGLRAIDRW